MEGVCRESLSGESGVVLTSGFCWANKYYQFPDSLHEASSVAKAGGLSVFSPRWKMKITLPKLDKGC